MNFLAHVYLSNDEPQVAVGNFISDHIKGKQYENYPTRIRKGILLHREIDTYTDSHPLTAEARTLLRPQFSRYAGIYLDMYYDYYLASNWSQYHTTPLKRYARKFYWWMVQNYIYLPVAVKGFLPNLIAKNRLYSYATYQGMYNALNIMSRYSSLPDQSVEAIDFLKEHDAYLKQNFTDFFAELKKHVSDISQRY